MIRFCPWCIWARIGPAQEAFDHVIESHPLEPLSTEWCLLLGQVAWGFNRSEYVVWLEIEPEEFHDLQFWDIRD